jgi:hypothetical protein
MLQESAGEVNTMKLVYKIILTAEFSMGTTLVVREIWSILSYLSKQQFKDWMSYPNVICMGSDSQFLKLPINKYWLQTNIQDSF